MPRPTPPKPHPGRCGGRWSSIELTATTNTNALANPATVRSSSHPIMLGSSGIAARVTTNTTSDARHATIDRASRGDAVPASEIADVVRGGQRSRGLRGEGGPRGHQRQDRGVGAASDAHGGTQPGGAAADVCPVRVHCPTVRWRDARMPRPNCSQLRGAASQAPN